ncbi:hypothetical protein JXA32_15025 [Candidatus Sumerlaeota bacterium]|nr:hypothetical protein [Candidatus Sumerlaeota bacterium]
MRWWSKLIVILAIALAGYTFYLGMWNWRDARRETRQALRKSQAAVNKAAGVKRQPDSGSLEFARQCRSNLQAIETAKRKFAQESGRVAGNVTWEEIMPYLPQKGPLACPSVGKYTLNPLGTVCSCSIGANYGHGTDDDHIIQGF